MSLLKLESIGGPRTTVYGHTIQQSILDAMFDRHSNDIDFIKASQGINVYFNDWYEEQCQQCRREVSVRTEAELMEIIGYLRDPQETRASIRRRLLLRHTAGQTQPPHSSQQPAAQNPSASDLNASITLAARLFLMISVGDFGHSVTIGQPIPWGDGGLQPVIDDIFAPGIGQIESFRLPKIFDALNLERIAGIKVFWTSNLADHLLMNDDEGTVTLFHHVTFLKMHQESDCVLLSDTLVSETILTLALLFPSNAPAVRKYFEKCRIKWSLDPAAGTCGHLNTRMRKIESFSHWRDRLTILKQAFDDSEPHTVWQWWHDDRKKVQWWTFWIAALVLLLTIIQMVSALIQTWATVKSMN